MRKFQALYTKMAKIFIIFSVQFIADLSKHNVMSIIYWYFKGEMCSSYKRSYWIYLIFYSIFIIICRLFSHPVADADSGQRLGGTVADAGDASSSSDKQPKTDIGSTPSKLCFY